MAYVTEFTCNRCAKLRYEAVHTSGVCLDCRAADATAAEDAYMAERQRHSLTARIAFLERELYRSRHSPSPARQEQLKRDEAQGGPSTLRS